MVQKDGQAAAAVLTEPDQEANPNPLVPELVSPVPAAEDTDTETETSAGRRFLCGVVEGFYGRPWTMEQRKELFRRLQKWGLNTYLYAPKDDYKHRMFWREMYSVEEADQLMTLISAAQEFEIEFIYAISPGLDITFSNQKELSTLKRKLDQVTQFGCKSFALLFDDIDHNMCPADKEVFSSFAHAQISITNEIYQYLGEPETFLFCPTEYCGTFCYPNAAQSPYLRTVGEKLLPGIEVLWTGPKVVSKEISVESIEEVSKIIKRSPLIWDNIHANDYDQKRLFLGPYKGRSTELIPRLNGVLTNPNCEFEPNYVAIHTLATWYKSNMNGVRKDVVMTDSEDSTVSIQIKLENEGSDEELETDVLYSPQMALKLALIDWLQEFGVPHQYSNRQVAHSGAKATVVGMAPLNSTSCLNASTTVTTVYQQPIMSQGTAGSADPPMPPKEEEEEKKQLDEEPMEMVVEKMEDVNKNQILTDIVEAKMSEELKPMDTDKESVGEGKSSESCMQEDVCNDIAPMQTDEQINKELFIPGPNEKPLYTAEALTLEDLQLLVDLFYLPYEHGPKGAQMLKEFQWLRANSSVVSVNCVGKDTDKISEWRDRAVQFEEMCNVIMTMFTRLSNCPNRTILYDLYPYVWDIKSIISMVKSFVQWLGCRSQSSAQFLSGDQEPWAFRGGLAGEFQRLLPIEGANDLFFQPPPLTPTSKIYTIRPYYPKDESSVYRICREMYDDAMDDLPFESQPDLIGDKLVGGLLSHSLDYCFVLEDEDGICGYAVGTADVSPFLTKCKHSWIPFMQEKYTKPKEDKELSEAEKIMLSFHEEQEILPDTFLASFPSLIKMDIHKKVTDPSVAKGMMGCLLSSLKANGSRGAFCEVKPDDKRIMDFYSKLGCFEIAKMEGFPKDIVILGRSL
ncbi:protein O-GlcNAcase [Bufo gargarizans]|uniref:protein O-GlcNAcase n=1 Tax=Bufo gargarizans TaxID=30331 RepID=UPI001CF5A963|nr:protein O-GlcNAcase [Bufo gargarizans]